MLSVVGVVRQIGVIVQAIDIMKYRAVKFDRRCISLIVSARARNQKRACNRQKIECPFHSFNLVNLCNLWTKKIRLIRVIRRLINCW